MRGRVPDTLVVGERDSVDACQVCERVGKWTHARLRICARLELGGKMIHVKRLREPDRSNISAAAMHALKRSSVSNVSVREQHVKPKTT
eukprot:365339-Chlamydomonas_euryale.AAC.11